MNGNLADQERPNDTQAASIEQPEAKKTTVLVVEDDAATRKLIVRALGEDRYRIVEATDGLEALVLACELDGAVQVLLTDVIMPRMSGVDLAKRLLPHCPYLRVVLMSGQYNPAAADHHVIKKLPFVSKPFGAGALAAAIERALSLPPPVW